MLQKKLCRSSTPCYQIASVSFVYHSHKEGFLFCTLIFHVFQKLHVDWLKLWITLCFWWDVSKVTSYLKVWSLRCHSAVSVLRGCLNMLARLFLKKGLGFIDIRNGNLHNAIWIWRNLSVMQLDMWIFPELLVQWNCRI
jgi:hypothetical protein